MKACKLSIAVTFYLIGLISANIESLPPPSSPAAAAVPFHLISAAEFNAISELSDGNPFITQKRLLSSGSQSVKDIIKSIFTGLIRFVYIVGLDSALDSALKPSSGPAQGYPFCSIQANGNNKHIKFQRNLDGFDDPTNNFGTIPLNFFYPGLVNIENIDDQTTTEELRHLFKPFKSDWHDHLKPSSQSVSSDDNKDKHDNVPPPVFNCIVVLKESAESTTTTPPPPTTPSPPSYPQVPNIYPQGNSLNPYQVVALPYPPYLGLVGQQSQASDQVPTWSGSQQYPSNNPPSVAIPPTWPYWSSMANPYVVSQ